MKQLFAILIIFLAAATSFGQGRGDGFLKQADEAMAAKEYIKARFFYLKAYEAFSKDRLYA